MKSLGLKSERIELQSHPSPGSASASFARPPDEKQSGRKSSPSRPPPPGTVSLPAGVFWAVARHLPGIYPRFAYLSAPLISGSGRNDRETANEIRSSAEIVKRIRKLLACRDERVLRSSLRGKASDGNDKENRFSDLRTSITGAARGGERYWITLLSRSRVIRSVVCYIGFPAWRKELILMERREEYTREGLFLGYLG